ncbi:MAG: hypothetical protein K2X93_26610 [Candidatus Obscuribacterales bacterium]|nr:hypothetical protein [Candidatus Obscuribacterales bacterium]
MTSRASIRFDERQCTRLELWILSIMILLSLGSVSWFLLSHPNLVSAEAALRIDIATHVLEGKRIYLDIFDKDPPVGIVLYLIPALISKVCGLDLLVTFIVCAILTQIFSLTTCLWLLRQSEVGKNEYVLCLFAFAFLLISNIFILEFGAHEHVLVWLATPYILIRWLRSQGVEVSRDLSFLIGLGAGLACWQIFFYLGLPLVLELLLLLESKRFIGPLFCPELVGCAIGLASIPLFFLLSPEVSGFYWTSIFPIVTAGFAKIDHTVTYWYASPDDRNMIYGAIAICMTAHLFPRVESLGRVFYVFSLIGLALFIFEKNGASGQLIFHVALALFVGAIIFGEGLEQLNRRGKLRLLTLAILIVSCGVMIVSMNLWNTWACEIATKLDPKLFKPYQIIDKYSKPGDQILWANDNPNPGYPIVLASRRKTTPPFLWGFPLRVLSENGEVNQYGAPTEASPVLTACASALIDEGIAKSITNGEPKIIVFQVGRSEGYLRNNPKIAMALEAKYKAVDDSPVPGMEPTYSSGIGYIYVFFVRKT